jgi:hypothetical protein
MIPLRMARGRNAEQRVAVALADRFGQRRHIPLKRPSISRTASRWRERRHATSSDRGGNESRKPPVENFSTSDRVTAAPSAVPTMVSDDAGDDR